MKSRIAKKIIMLALLALSVGAKAQTQTQTQTWEIGSPTPEDIIATLDNGH